MVADQIPTPGVEGGGVFEADLLCGRTEAPRSRKGRAKFVTEVSMQTAAKLGVGPKRCARHRLDIDTEDGSRLERLAATFQLPRSEVVRRLIRAASECGPALSKDGAAAIIGLTRESRAIERRLREFVATMQRGGWRSSVPSSRAAVGSLSNGAVAVDDLGADAGDLELVVSRLINAYSAMNRELNEVTVGYGSRLRSLLGGSESAR